MRKTGKKFSIREKRREEERFSKRAIETDGGEERHVAHLSNQSSPARFS